MLPCLWAERSPPQTPAPRGPSCSPGRPRSAAPARSLPPGRPRAQPAPRGRTSPQRPRSRPAPPAPSQAFRAASPAARPPPGEKPVLPRARLGGGRHRPQGCPHYLGKKNAPAVWGEAEWPRRLLIGAFLQVSYHAFFSPRLTRPRKKSPTSRNAPTTWYRYHHGRGRLCD